MKSVDRKYPQLEKRSVDEYDEFSWYGIFTTIRNSFHTFIFCILKSAYLYHSWFFFKFIFFRAIFLHENDSHFAILWFYCNIFSTFGEVNCVYLCLRKLENWPLYSNLGYVYSMATWTVGFSVSSKCVLNKCKWNGFLKRRTCVFTWNKFLYVIFTKHA